MEWVVLLAVIVVGMMLMFTISYFWHGRCKTCKTKLVQGYTVQYGEDALMTWCPHCDK